MKSLQVRLSVAISIAAAAFALLAGAWSFVEAFEQAKETQDQRLRAIDHLFAGYEIPTPQKLGAGPEAKFDAYVAVETVGVMGAQFFGLPADTPEGFRTVVINGEAWRVFISVAAESGRHLAVGQRTVIRNAIARKAGLWTAVPLLVLVPILCSVIFLLVRQMLKPVAEFSMSLDRRTDSDLSPLQSDRLPGELGPIVVAINSLLRRLSRSMEMQRRLVADVAHELRSPLAALSIQVENVGRLVSGDEAISRLEPLRLGIARARTLMEKILALARAQMPAVEMPASCDTEMVVRSVLEELLPLADARNIEIDVVRIEPLSLAVSEFDLMPIFRNLIDNAIRYSNAGDIVEVGVWKSEQGVCVEVKDHGPGIAVAERERVFSPFYRILGTDEPGNGLGLSIASTIVQRLGGSITLDWTLDRQQKGLKVQVLLPVPITDHVGGDDGGQTARLSGHPNSPSFSKIRGS